MRYATCLQWVRGSELANTWQFSVDVLWSSMALLTCITCCCVIGSSTSEMGVALHPIMRALLASAAAGSHAKLARCGTATRRSSATALWHVSHRRQKNNTAAGQAPESRTSPLEASSRGPRERSQNSPRRQARLGAGSAVGLLRPSLCQWQMHSFITWWL